MGSMPGRETKIPHALEQLSPFALQKKVHVPQHKILVRWMNLEPIIQSEVSQRKTDMVC